MLGCGEKILWIVRLFKFEFWVYYLIILVKIFIIVYCMFMYYDVIDENLILLNLIKE